MYSRSTACFSEIYNVKTAPLKVAYKGKSATDKKKKTGVIKNVRELKERYLKFITLEIPLINKAVILILNPITSLTRADFRRHGCLSKYS